MFPIKDKYTIGYRWGQKTSYTNFHLGLDCVCPKGTPVYAPFNGRVTTLVGTEGGNTVWFYWNNLIMRVMHLSKFGKTGEVNKGDIIGYVGTTGILSTGNHAHIDISKNNVNINILTNFLDPEKFNWENNMHYEGKTIEDLDNDLFITNQALLDARNDLAATDKLRIQGLATITELQKQLSNNDAQNKLNQIKLIIG